MLLQKRISEQLELVVQKKLTVENFCKCFQISRSWAFELLKRKKQGEKLEKDRGHRMPVFNDKDKSTVRRIYSGLMLADGQMPSMTVLRNCVKMEHPDFPDASIETYRKTVLNMVEYPEKQVKKTYRKRFEAPSVGFMIQGDVTTHAWIDSAYPFPLLLFIDDKSRYVLWGDFIDSDNTENHKKAVKDWLKTYGKPIIVYYDNDPKYAKGGVIRLLLEKLGIQVVNTKPYKPQGKGKLERKNGVFQKQLVYYIKHRKAQSLDEARKVLKWYIDEHNQTYNREIQATPEKIFKNADDAFIYLTKTEWESVEQDFAVNEKRKVSKINEISFDGRLLMVPSLDNVSLSGRWVDVIVRSQYWIKIYYKTKLVKEYPWGEIYD